MLLLFAWTSGAQMSSGDYGFTMTSPYRSLPKTQRILNEFALDLRLQMGYTESERPDVQWKTADAPGIIHARRFARELPDNTLRTVEIIVSRAAADDLIIRVAGATLTAAGELPNPDLATLRGTLDLLLRQQPPEAPPQPGATPANTGQYMVQLSYVQADRAIAMLKALGYTTIEFNRQQGESNTESAFEPLRKGTATLPAILKMIDASKTSLMDPNPALSVPGAIPLQQPFPQFGQPQRQAVPDIGGTYLHQTTSGEPLQRLLILYDENDPASLERILSVLTEQIDVPARQVVISALIVEVNSDRLRDLGITFRGTSGRVTTTFLENPTTGDQQPFTFTFDENMPRGTFNITATISALVDRGEAEILSNPSVLVLDGRQARIQVGQQVPVVNSTATAAEITSSVEYFPVGIVLNLRPRISDDGTEVTMQVETIVSAVGATQPVGTGVFFAPTVDNRQVQTFVRVEDSTPFIIGGLISTDERNRRTGLPLLSQIPFLGGLFRTTTLSKMKREVIVVLTPHVVPLEERSFSYVIPKDSDIFDSFGNKLFRNAYRIRSRDVYDLRFVYESDILRNVMTRARSEAAVRPSLTRTEPFGSLLRGEVPGEDILVRRMLWEIVRRSGFANKLSNDRIIFFEPSPGDRASTDFVLSFFKQKLDQLGPGNNALVLSFDAESRGTPDHPFVQPKADVSFETITRANYEKRLIELNARAADGRPQKWGIIISNEYSGSVAPLDVLRSVLVLKRLLALNSSLPLTIKDFHVGRQIIFPTEDDIQQGFHVVDRDAARLFYEVMQYYRAFEQEFNVQMQAVQR
jgi:hypothetical protein